MKFGTNLMYIAARPLTLVMIALVLLGVGFGASVAAQAPRRGTREDNKVSSDFEARAKQYLDSRKKVASKAPKRNDSPTVIVSSQRELGDKVRVARAGAKQGEIFTPEIAEYFRRQIAATLAGPHGSEIRASLRHAEPVKMELPVNESYPEDVPLQSTPPTLLLNLPQLPDALEYRILGRELVLRDREANIVVDYVPNALPDFGK
jgi:hypothetical protein